MLSYVEPAVTVEEAESYFLASGETWAGDEAALMRGQRYIAATYNSRWLALFDNEAAPEAVKFAIFEAAKREAASPGSLAPDYDPAQRVVSERMGPMATEYADGVAPGLVVPIIDGLLKQVIVPGRGRTHVASVLRA